jgi:hypothetical protein
MRIMACAAAAVLGFGGLGAASAQEAWVGAYAHDVKDGLSLGGYEDDTTQIAAGVISQPLGSLARIGRPSAYLLTAFNTRGGTNYAAAGLSWRIALGGGGRVYLRPGLGVAVHDGEVDLPSPYAPQLSDAERASRFDRGGRELDLGSRFLFQPELALGFRASERVAVEASYMHISHGTVFGDQNPGLTDVGVRLLYNFGR